MKHKFSSLRTAQFVVGSVVFITKGLYVGEATVTDVQLFDAEKPNDLAWVTLSVRLIYAHKYSKGVTNYGSPREEKIITSDSDSSPCYATMLHAALAMEEEMEAAKETLASIIELEEDRLSDAEYEAQQAAEANA